MGELFQTIDEMYSEYLIFFRCADLIIDEDRIIDDKYEYIQWSTRNNSRLYKLHHKYPLISVKSIPDSDYNLIESHYQYLKLKYG